MRTHEKRISDLGTVLVLVLSSDPTRILLIKDMSFKKPFWKLPGGHIETTDFDVISAGIREVREETSEKDKDNGLKLLREEVELFSEQWNLGAIYYPHLCVARNVSEEKLKALVGKMGYENDHPVEIGIFEMKKALKMYDLFKKHRSFICEVLMEK